MKNNNNNRTCKNKSCKDFYTEINHKWLKTHRIEKHQSCLDLFHILETKNEIELKKCFENLKKKDKKVNKICKSFSHYNNDLTIQRILALWQRFQDSEGDIYKTFGLSIQYGIDILFSVIISDDFKKPETKCISIVETSLSSNDILIFLHPQSLESKKFKKVFILFLNNIFKCVFGNKHLFQVEDIWDTEVEIAKYMYKEPAVPIETFYNVFNTNKLFYSFDFKKLFSVMGLSSSTIIIHNPKFFEHYLNLFETPKMKTYFLYRVIIQHSHFHKELRKLCFSFYSKYLHGIKKEKSFEADTFKLLHDGILNISLSKEYLKKTDCSKEIQLCKEICQDIVKQMIVRISNNTFLHHGTKEKATDKIKNVRFVIGSSENFQLCLLDTLRLEDISDENPFINIQLFRDFVRNQTLKHFNEKRVLLTKEWDQSKCGNVYDVNAYYLASDNTIVLPLGILKPPFLDVKKSLAHNLGFLGSTIGHELFHAIDDEGCKFDKFGNYNNWWSKQDLVHYKKSQKYIVKMYEDYAKQNDNIKINGKISLGENIADIGGMLVSEMVLLENKNQNQDQDLKEFFIAYAKQWRILYSKKEFETKRMYDVHALFKYRTNCVLLFSKNFQRLYKKDNKDYTFFW
jgi:putative endopeptidase